jgi:hypothetical protein
MLNILVCRLECNSGTKEARILNGEAYGNYEGRGVKHAVLILAKQGAKQILGLVPEGDMIVQDFNVFNGRVGKITERRIIAKVGCHGNNILKALASFDFDSALENAMKSTLEVQEQPQSAAKPKKQKAEKKRPLQFHAIAARR